jgi:putative peptidoglycan lipid II flippase
MQGLKETLAFSLKIVFFVLVPSTVGLMALAKPITRVLFERGFFTAYSTAITSSALFFYAAGLVACGGSKILVSAFYSLQDTMTPVKTAFLSLIVNIALSIALMGPLKVGGLALATSLAATLNFAALYILLAKRIGDFGTAGIADSFLRVLLAAAAMAAVIKFALPEPRGAAGLAVSIGASVIIFSGATYILKVNEMRSFLAWISRKR